MICPRCGSENLDDARFCSSCGASLEQVSNTRRSDYRGRSALDCFGLSGGALPSLLIGAIIIIIGLASIFGGGFGQMMGSWGGSFGEAIGSWGESFGERIGSWGKDVGRFFIEWREGFRMIGASVAILIGLAIVYFGMYERSS